MRAAIGHNTIIGGHDELNAHFQVLLNLLDIKRSKFTDYVLDRYRNSSAPL